MTKEIPAHETNVYQLFATKLPTTDYDYPDGYLACVEHHIKLAPGFDIILEEETRSFRINDAWIADVDEKIAGELLGLAKALGYTEGYEGSRDEQGKLRGDK